MSAFDNEAGGPAFPFAIATQDNNGQPLRLNEAQGGMTLRDWFAGQALGNIIRNGILEDFEPEAAARAYRYADAMIAERS